MAVALSRVLVLAGAIVGATLTHRVGHWQLADPGHLTMKLGSLGNVLASAGVRWDSVHYLTIAEHGYNTASNTVFFPLYPLLIKVVTWVTSSYVISGLLVSVGSFAVSLLLLHRLVREELGDRAADATVLLLAFSPLSLFFTAIYTESLFLSLCLGAFLLARRGRWGWAGIAASAATLTHIEGVLLIAPLAIFYWQDQRAAFRPGRAAARRATVGALPLLIPMLALAGFLVYLHSRGYGWLAPSSNERYYTRHFVGPVLGVVQGVSAGIGGLAHMLAGGGSSGARDDAFQNVVYLAVLAICLATLALAWRCLPKAYSVFSALCLLICVSSPVTGAPLNSLDRFVLVLFPLWMVAGKWLDEHRRLGAVLTGSGALLFVFALQFARWAFIG
ncbi:MAG: mannosyltransferase family protein [Solirubrobacteraceae bacterium]